EDNVGALASEAGSIICREVDSGNFKWEFRSHTALTVVGGAAPVVPAQLAKGGAAFERNNNTVYAAVTSTRTPAAAGVARVRVPQILGLNADPQLRVRLAGPTDSQISPIAALTITTVGSDGITPQVVPQTTTDAQNVVHTVYTVDRESRTILFSNEEAGWASDDVGPLWGKPIWVDYARVNPAAAPTPPLELHVLQDILRFQYSPGIVRLQHGMVGYNGTPMVSFALPNGVPVAQNSVVLNEAAFTALTAGLPAGWTGVLPRGIIDVSDLQLPNGEGVLPGSEIVVTYTYFDDVSGGAVTTQERCQVPVNFGASSAPLVLADRTLHIGTEGYRPDGVRGVPLLPGDTGPLSFNSVRRSFLSVVMDPLTQIVRGALAQPAIPEAETATYLTAGTPVVEGSASVDSGGLVVGSNMMTALNRSAPSAAGYQGEGLGFVSRLRPERTLICDNTRLVETVAGKPSWVCVGSHAAELHEGLTLDPANPDRDNQDRKVTPFSRPAKAIYLSNGNILVADSCNDRVIEIDRTGRQVWPLDKPSAASPAYEVGYDFYTSNHNSILDLERPSDCFRYYVEYRAGSAPRTSVNGSMLPIVRPNPAVPATWTGTETHTVIADAGHNRVIEVVTYVDWQGVQTHRVDILTPSAVRIGTQQAMTQLSYTKARPIFDPNNGNVTGYLCAAANVHQLVVVERGTRVVDPPASNRMPAGSGGTWSWLSWLYDSGSGSPSNPLIFRNIRDVELSYEGSQVFLTVTCGQFAGRLSRTLPNAVPHPLSLQGAGVFEYCLAQGAGGVWGRVTPTDAAAADTLPVTGDDPIWWF
ncbi:MAG: hypothetical protein WCP21_13200, partial [Armatimonadota bacterium]